MKKLERHTFYRGINRDVSPTAIATDGSRKLFPGSAYLLQNCRIFASPNGDSFSLENIKGNLKITNNDLPAGTNTVIGAFEDIESNRLIFCVHNSNNNHAIFTYDQRSESLSKKAQGSNLGFDTSYPITQGGIDGNVFYFTDGNSGVKSIDFDDAQISNNIEERYWIERPGPPTPPTVIRETNASNPLNRIAADSFQFCYRYIYSNNEVSPVSSWSKYSVAEREPDIDNNTGNRIKVTATFNSTDLTGKVKRIEFFYRKNSSDTWYFFTKVDGPNSSPQVVYFENEYQGFALSPEELNMTTSAIPNKSNALAFFKDRIWLTHNEIGHNVDDGSWSATLSRVTKSRVGSFQFKEGGVYSVAIMWQDGKGKESLARNVGQVTFPHLTPESGFQVAISSKQYIRLNLTGTPPSWATHYKILLSQEQYYNKYMQVPVILWDYVCDLADVGELILQNTHATSDDGFIYLKVRNDPKNNDLIHLQLPKEVPFVPEVGMYIRIKTAPLLFTKTARVIAVKGDKVVCSLSDLGVSVDNVNWITGGYRTQVAEFFSIQESSNDLFYEIGETHAVTNPLNATHDLQGDTQILANMKFSIRKPFSDAELATFEQESQYHFYLDNVAIESPTPTTITAQTDKNSVNKYQFGFVNILDTSGEDDKPGNNPDYTKSIDGYGRAHAEEFDQGQNLAPNTLAYSERRIQDTLINGLHDFSALNTYTIPDELSPIVSLQPVGNNRMLVIHERECTSISVGDGWIRTGASDGILTKTESVVGDDRALMGSLGTIYPESIQCYEGYVFFFDIYKGCIARYDYNGLDDISKYGMQNYFYQKSQHYQKYIDQGLKFYSGIDPYNKEYFITLPAIGGVSQETWAFNFATNAWVNKYDIYPEFYGKLGNNMFQFKAGELWKHGAGSTYNNFFGVQYDRKIEFWANADIPKVKMLLNIHIHSNSLVENTVSDADKKVIVVTDDEGQETHVYFDELTEKEGINYAQILRDINTPNKNNQAEARFLGDWMRSKAFLVQINTNVSSGPAKLDLVSVVTIISQYSK